MMLRIFQFLLFVFIVAVGFNAVPFFIVLALKAGFFPAITPGPHETAFQQWLIPGGLGAWILCSLAAVGNFMAETRTGRTALLWLPVYGPLLYAALVMIVFAMIAR